MKLQNLFTLALVAFPLLMSAGIYIGSSAPALDEISEMYDDSIVRVVYTYNAAGERASETIYSRPADPKNGTEEILLGRGNYSYEYDTQKRVVCKTVRYEQPCDYHLSDYRVTVNYDAEYTTFTRYGEDGNDGWQKESQWSYYNTGELASFSEYDDYYKVYTSETKFHKSGAIASARRDNGAFIQASGELNDSTIVSNRYDGDETRTVRYKYSPENGRLLYQKIDENTEYQIQYDKKGRMTLWREYKTNHNDDNYEIQNHLMAPAGMYLNEQTEFIYASDEVYNYNNPWRAAFGYEGPLSKVKTTYHGIITETSFERDSSGKLIAVKEICNDTESPRSYNYTVNSEGYITNQTKTDEYGTSEQKYTWSNGKCIRRESTDWTGWEHIMNYTYSSNGVKVFNDDLTVELTQESDRIRIVTTDNQTTKVDVTEVQKEDISFVIPNMMQDINGMEPERKVVVSVKDRVVAASCPGGHSEYSENGYGSEIEFYDYTWWRCNLGHDMYFSIEHVGDMRVCRDIHDLPIYVVDDSNRLIKKYSYYTVAYNTVSPVMKQRSINLPEDTGYYLETYRYNSEGLLIGKTVEDFGPDNTKENEVNIEYIYNSKLNSLEPVIVAAPGVNITGRTLNMHSGELFTVSTLDGKLICTNVDSHTFGSGGIYIITTTHGAIKVFIR